MALTQVTSIGLKDGEIVNADLHSAASVALSKLASTGALGSAITATTQSASDDSTKLATTAFVQAAVTSLIDGAPGSLNTLNELAAAINDDSSYATTLTTALATKLPLAGGTLTGALTVNGNITLGTGNASYIYMRDSDDGTRTIHCNSDRIGFLKADGNWGAYCADDGVFTCENNLVVNGGNSSYITMGDADEGSRIIHNNGNNIGFLKADGNWGVRCADDGKWDCLNGVNVTGGVDITGILSVYKTGTNTKLLLSRNESVGTDNTAIGVIDFANNTAHTVNARIMAKTSGTGNVGGQLVIETRDPSNSTLDERLRITSAGHMSLGGGASPSSTNGGIGLKFGIKSSANNILIGETTSSSHNGLILESRLTGRSGGARTSQINIGQDGTGGQIVFSTAPGSAGVSERVRITRDGKFGIGCTPTEQFHVLKSHNSSTIATVQNNYGANATAQLKLIAPTDEFQLVKYASGAAALNLSNNSRIYHSVGGEVRHQITADSAGQTACVVNTPADGGVRSQYLTATKAMSGSYNNFQVDIDQTSWGSFFLKIYVSGHDGHTAHKWVTGYCNTGFSTTRNVLSNMSGNFASGSGTLTHISGQTWKYVIATDGNAVTHPVMGVEFIFGGNGNMLDTGAISLTIS